ncbi:hypothetical protein BGZ63DRAFT_103589 [Mariannaea sp. PMI_226]|nr:hypothetical protein BGZ63DRAFT_103589 [Mariannaea sp. PMI_226]
MSYNVYLVASLGMPRDHHALFIETNSDGTGRLIHVTGNVQNGMEFEEREEKRPDDSETFVSKSFLGTIYAECYRNVSEICKSNAPPKKQFDGPKRLYPEEPLRRCQEWTAEVVESLVSKGILQTKTSITSSVE